MESETLEAKMFALRLTHPSVSSYMSLVLLVKKKDGSWNMCVKYRALNKITILYWYPISNIDKL